MVAPEHRSCVSGCVVCSKHGYKGDIILRVANLPDKFTPIYHQIKQLQQSNIINGPRKRKNTSHMNADEHAQHIVENYMDSLWLEDMEEDASYSMDMAESESKLTHRT